VNLEEMFHLSLGFYLQVFLPKLWVVSSKWIGFAGEFEVALRILNWYWYVHRCMKVKF
jgi:hypothetical protein